MKRYLETHKHIDFKVDLRDAPASTWVLLGEAKSKSQHVGRALLSPQAAAELLQVYLAKGMLATTAIEGNTLSEEEVRQVLQGTWSCPLLASTSSVRLRTCWLLTTSRAKSCWSDPDLPFTVERLREYNRLILDGLEVEKDVVPGEIRAHSVVVGPLSGGTGRGRRVSVGAAVSLAQQRRVRCPCGRASMGAPLAIVKAVVAHLYLAWIHPFGDGNGRTARLLELQILLSAGFPVPTCQLLSNHYNQTRTEYYRQLSISSREAEGLLSFLAYAAQGFVDQLREQLDGDLEAAIRRSDGLNTSTKRFGDRRSETDIGASSRPGSISVLSCLR